MNISLKHIKTFDINKAHRGTIRATVLRITLNELDNALSPQKN